MYNILFYLIIAGKNNPITKRKGEIVAISDLGMPYSCSLNEKTESAGEKAILHVKSTKHND